MNVLLVDDHHVVREAISVLLKRAAPDIEVVGASAVDQAIEKIGARPRFDVILLDFKMPGMSGLSGLSAIQKAAPNIPIAIFSGDIAPEEAKLAVQRGVRGIISKSIHGTGLVSALRELAGGGSCIPASLRDARESSDSPVLEQQQRAALGHLTPREMDCVRLLVQGGTNRLIAEQLQLAEVTIKLHLHSAYKKMGARNRSDAVRIAIMKGVTVH
jgi:DNA-binding NarL/FixJ family response regulator